MKQFLAFFAAIFTLAASATNHQVQVGSNFFNPSALTVAMGDTVTWTQVSGAHNVNGSLSTFPSNPAGFSSGSVAGGTWTYSFQFNLAGVYNYQCDPHIPSMVGTVTVTAGSQSIQAGSYTFGSTGNVTSFAYNGPALTGVTASSLIKNGITSTISSNGFRGNNWPLGATDGSNTFTGTIDPTKYIEFTLTAATGQTFSNPKVRFTLARSGTGPRQWAWRSSINTFSSNIPIDSLNANVTANNGEMTVTDANTTYPNNVFQLTQSNLTTVTFRLYGFNAESATGTGGLQTALEFFVTIAGSGGGGGGGGGTPTIRFVGSSATVLEANVSHTVKMHVQPHLMMAGSVSLTATADAGFVFGSDATTTPALSGTTLTLPVPSMTDTVSFTINVIDDNLIEGPESAVFAIASASTGLSIGAPNSYTFTIADNDVFIPTYTLPQVKGVNAQFLPDSSGKMCKLVGTVLGVNTQTFATTGNLGFTIHDGSVGFGVFGAGSKNLGYTVNEGDIIRVIGVIGHFNGLAQINADSIVVISTNGALPSPVVITDLNESTESQLIRMNNVYVINSAQWTNVGSGFPVNVTNGPDTIQLRIDADVSDVFSAPCPVGTFDVIGIGGQFDSSPPHSSGYQMLPRYLADFIFPVPVTYDLAITEIMASSNDPNTSISDDWFEITNYGSSAVDLGGFSWDDNSWLPGTVVFPSMVIAPGEAIVVAQIDSVNEAAFRSVWNLGPWVQVLVNEDFAIGQPIFNSSGDGVALFDTSSTPIDICRAEFSLALTGFSVEFDTACTYLGNSTVGVRGAYASTGSDVGSPGNQSIGFSENSLRVGFSPNPTNGLVAIRMPSVGEYHIVLRNLNGQILASQVVNADHAEINLSGLARGMYLVDVVSEAGHAIERIVRN